MEYKHTDENPHDECIGIIAAALRRGITLRAISTCSICGNVSAIDMNLRAGEECREDDTRIHPRFDIAIIDAHAQVLRGIEVRNLHATSSYDFLRSEFEWIEIEANDTNKRALMTAADASIVSVVDVRRVCSHCVRDESRRQIVTIRQQGAGSGKTFGALLDMKKHLIAGRRVFIYTSKTSAAIGTLCGDSWREIFSAEFSHDFEYIHDASADCIIDKIRDSSPCADIHTTSKRNKITIDKRNCILRWQYAMIGDQRIPFVVIFCTIDSMIYGILHGSRIKPSREKRAGEDTFIYNANMVASCENYRALSMDRWLGKWRNRDVPLGAEFKQLICQDNVHVFIDEAQDLSAYYAAAIGQFTRLGVGLTIVGDALQAVYDVRIVKETGLRAIRREAAKPVDVLGHAMELLDAERSMLPENFPEVFTHASTKVDSSNIVRRCKNRDWPHILGKLVNFKSANLEPPRFYEECAAAPSPREIEGEAACASAARAPDDQHLIEIWLVRELREKDNPEKIEEVLHAILNENVAAFPLPEQYTVVLPIIKVAESAMIETSAECFWSARLGDSAGSPMYTMRHMSETSEPIDITKSEKQMRVMSIHASKGSGRDVVIWWGASDNILRTYDYDATGSISRCLRHVALTRHKKKLILVMDSTSPLLSELLQARDDAIGRRCIHIHNYIRDRAPIENLMFTRLRMTETIRCNARRYPATFAHVASPELAKQLEWKERFSELFSEDASRRMTGEDMTKQAILSVLLETYIAMYCWVYNREGAASSGVTKSNVGIIAVLRKNAQSRTIFQHVDDFGEYYDGWSQVRGILGGERIFSKLLPKIAIRLKSFYDELAERNADARFKVFCKAIDTQSRDARLALIEDPENMDLVLMMFYIYQNGWRGGFGEIGENDMVRALRALKIARAKDAEHIARMTPEEQEAPVPREGVIIEETIGLIKTASPLLKALIRDDDKIYIGAQILSQVSPVEESRKHLQVRASQRSIIIANKASKYCYLAVIIPKITELNYMDTIASSLIALRCIYIHNREKTAADDGETPGGMSPYIARTRKFGIRFITLNSDQAVFGGCDRGLMLIDDETVTKYVTQKTSPSDDDIAQMFDDQIVTMFDQIEVSARYLHACAISRAHVEIRPHGDMFERMFTKLRDECLLSRMQLVINQSVYDMVNARRDEIIQCARNQHYGPLGELRDELLEMIHDQWMATITEHMRGRCPTSDAPGRADDAK